MIRITLLALIITSQLISQDYRWPIKASQSLSATFCEYRDGHLHAGIDIKTWGEMEVPCYAIQDGYIEQVIVGYSGYGRGLFLRLNDGYLAVYGHLELFMPQIEALIEAEQKAQERHNIRLKFGPDDFPVKAGQRVAYSGTSGTEHPHLHFEIRDTSRQVINPQLFYLGIVDKKKPVLDEILLLPGNSNTRINNSKFPVIIDVDNADEPISTTGPVRIAINAHDRANGTFNKYNIYRAAAFINDSLIFSYRFDRIPLWLTDSVEAVYPGARGKRKWRFMSMFDAGMQTRLPFTPEHLDGLITPQSVSTLDIRIADIHRNINSKEFILSPEANAFWSVSEVQDQYVITRKYAGNNYERYEFYTGNNTFLPISQTYYRMYSTSWILPKTSASDGVRAIGAFGGKIRWIVPPSDQVLPEIETTWVPQDSGYILSLESSEPFIYPIALRITGNSIEELVELFQTSATRAESDILSLEARGLSDKIELLSASSVISSAEIKPLTLLHPADSVEINFAEFGISFKAFNMGIVPLFLQVDTLTADYSQKMTTGIRVSTLGSSESSFNGFATFQHPVESDRFSLYTPGRKNTWKQLESETSLKQSRIDINRNGEFFLIRDDQGPEVQAQGSYSRLKIGDRLLFSLDDASGVILYRDSSFVSTLDGVKFYPDYNPLRKELSFHIPKSMSPGKHTFALNVSDGAGNITKFTYDFSVIR